MSAAICYIFYIKVINKFPPPCFAVSGRAMEGMVVVGHIFIMWVHQIGDGPTL